VRGRHGRFALGTDNEGKTSMLIITHGGAGRHDDATLESAIAELRGGDPVTVLRCRTPDELGKALDEHGDETVVAAGGDGSIHQLVATLYSRGELDRRTVGLLPLGTGNDLARNLGIPLDPQEAARLIREGRARELDLLADEDGGVVLNAVHVGVGATAARHAARFKAWLKSAAFPVGAVLAGARSSGWRLRVEADGKVVTEEKLLMVGLSNAPGIAGGSARLAPDASPGDGRAELVVSAATGPLARVRYALGLRKGAHKHHDDVVYTAVTSATISGEEFLVNSDGEVSGPYTRRSWRVLPKAWRIITPD
jgi:YegS/Rv2252/BmrU family lipid kinase